MRKWVLRRMEREPRTQPERMADLARENESQQRIQLIRWQ